jgi:hypothetical protein
MELVVAGIGVLALGFSWVRFTVPELITVKAVEGPELPGQLLNLAKTSGSEETLRLSNNLNLQNLFRLDQPSCYNI